MHLGRIRVTGTLTLRSPLHMGSGETFTDEDVTRRLPADRQDEALDVRINAIVRDVDNKPYIPGSTLKGILRAALRNVADADDLFGSIDPDDHNNGRMGRLWIYGAPLISAREPGVLKDRPHAEVKAQTRIDRRTGTAEAAKLFHSEMVPAGATFAFSARLGTGTVVDEDEVVRLAGALAPLTREGAVTLGKGGRQGHGRAVLTVDAVVHERFDIGDGVWTAGDEAVRARFDAALAAAVPVERETFTLRLACDGPYLTVDALNRPPRGVQKDEERRPIPILCGADGKPVLWGSSLLGALRQRAAWLAEIDRLRNPGAHRGGDRPMDDRDPDRAVLTKQEVAGLEPVERLFGVPGYRGRLGIERLTWTGGSAEPVDVTSVSIDRFTGGAREGALFTTQVVYGARFDATFRLEVRTPAGTAQDGGDDSDRTFCDRLIGDIRTNGLFLGAGAAKGFGWFTVTDVPGDEQ